MLTYIANFPKLSCIFLLTFILSFFSFIHKNVFEMFQFTIEKGLIYGPDKKKIICKNGIDECTSKDFVLPYSQFNKTSVSWIYVLIIALEKKITFAE